MRFLLFMAFVSLSLPVAACAESSNLVTVLTHSSRRQNFEWRVAEEKLRAHPKWDIKASAVPLEPRKAFQIAEDWMRKRHSEPELVRIEIQSLGARSKSLSGHYIYVIEFVTGAFDSMPVVILMDGTVVEPTPLVRNAEK